MKWQSRKACAQWRHTISLPPAYWVRAGETSRLGPARATAMRALCPAWTGDRDRRNSGCDDLIYRGRSGRLRLGTLRQITHLLLPANRLSWHGPARSRSSIGTLRRQRLLTLRASRVTARTGRGRRSGQRPRRATGGAARGDWRSRYRGRTDNLEAGSIIISQNLLPDTDMALAGSISRHGRATCRSDWCQSRRQMQCMSLVDFGGGGYNASIPNCLRSTAGPHQTIIDQEFDRNTAENVAAKRIGDADNRNRSVNLQRDWRSATATLQEVWTVATNTETAPRCSRNDGQRDARLVTRPRWSTYGHRDWSLNGCCRGGVGRQADCSMVGVSGVCHKRRPGSELEYRPGRRERKVALAEHDGRIACRCVPRFERQRCPPGLWRHACGRRDCRSRDCSGDDHRRSMPIMIETNFIHRKLVTKQAYATHTSGERLQIPPL